jgi:hypothetical protein
MLDCPAPARAGMAYGAEFYKPEAMRAERNISAYGAVFLFGQHPAWISFQI